MVGIVWVKGTWYIMLALWSASKDSICKGVLKRVIVDICLKLCLPVLDYVYMFYGDVRYLWGIRYYITGRGICYQLLFTRVVLDGDIIVLQAEQLSVKAGWHIYQAFQLDLLKGLVVTLNSECMAKTCGTILHQRHRHAFHTLCWHSAVLQVLGLLRKRHLAGHLGVGWY